MKQNWGMDIIRSFFAVIDRAVYSLITTTYQIILDLANATILSSSVIEDLYSRMYTLLGIFMLFKVSFSFINYVINPDKFLDKSQGVQNLVKNTIIVLALIIITPFAFDELYKVQRAILGDNLIPKFVLGVDSSDSTSNNLNLAFNMSERCTSSYSARTDGDYLSLMTFRPFFQLEDGAKINDDKLVLYCGTSSATISSYLKENIYNMTSSNIYTVDYKLFLSSVVGIFVELILISFCFDIAVRSIKLAFLQMIAPVPIISYIDPASNKNGTFSKWLKQVGSTWASLFVRLLAIFFAVLIISKIDLIVISDSAGEHKFWVMLFILIGALIFAKQLPKLIEELIPGLKLGGLNLNPFKKVSNEALGGKQLLGLGTAGLGAVLGSASNLGAHIKDKIDEANDKKDMLEAGKKYQHYQNRYKETGRAEFKRAADREEKKMWDASDKFTQSQEKRLKNFSFSHPVLSNISQTLTGAKLGYSQGKNGKFNAMDIGKQSASRREYNNNYSIKDRATDKATDFFGIKNDSGTTSEVAGDIKKNEELLTRINRNIEMMNRSFADLNSKMGPTEFATALSMDKDGRYQMNPSYNNATYLSDIKSLLSQMNGLEEQRLGVTKEIKRLQKIKDQKPQKK